MLRNFLLLTALSAGLFFFPVPSAQAGSPYDFTAYDDISAAYDHAASAYFDNPDNLDAYYAYYYSYYAQYYASFAYTYDYQSAWYYAWYYADCASSYALDDYDLTWDSSSFYAYYYAYYGSLYAWDAYTY